MFMCLCLCFLTGIIQRGIVRTAIKASGYFQPGEFINKEPSVGHHEFPVTEVCNFSQTAVNDNNNSTCVNSTVDGRHLQAVFRFPYVRPTRNLSVEVITRNTEGCSSPSWTWFMGLGCVLANYTECAQREATIHVMTCMSCTMLCHGIVMP